MLKKGKLYETLLPLKNMSLLEAFFQCRLEFIKISIIQCCVCAFLCLHVWVWAHAFTCTLSGIHCVLFSLINPLGRQFYYAPYLSLSHTSTRAHTNVLKHAQRGNSWLTDLPCSFVPETPAQFTTSHPHARIDTNTHTHPDTNWQTLTAPPNCLSNSKLSSRGSHSGGKK